MLERRVPQLVLTSTSHRKATSLMPGRLLDALTVDDGETLVLVWGAPRTPTPPTPRCGVLRLRTGPRTVAG